MQATAIQTTPPVFLKNAPAIRQGQKPISWKDFQRKYLSRVDGFKYEWVNGLMEKRTRSMDKSQLYLLFNLQKLFRKLLNQGAVDGDLISEPDLFFLTNHRRPDIAWLTTAQIYSLADPDAYEVPAFVIEVISTNDQINKMKEKMANYRDAGVQVVWHVFPNFEQVDVYSGPNLDKMTICSGDAICSAAPALPGFEIPASEVFQKKP